MINKEFNSRNIDDNKYDLFKLGKRFFLLGTFFLPSTTFISSIFLFLSLLIGLKFNKRNFFEDKLNLVLILVSTLLIISCFFNGKYLHEIDPDWTGSLSWLGLFNFIPFFFCFWGFQPYLVSSENRETFVKVLLSGSTIIIITGLGQQFFNWHGPFIFLNGLITWYQKPIESDGLTGLFSNSNYTGCWLGVIWPFCLALFTQKNKNLLKKLVLFVILISVSLSLILTYSRSSLIGLLISNFLLFSYGKLFFYAVLIFSILIFFLNYLGIMSIFNYAKLIEIISLEKIFNIGIRGDIWLNTIKFISEKPLLGWGAASFQFIFPHKEEYINHSHNLFLEIALNYGILPAILIFIFITYLLISSLKKLFFQKNMPENFLRNSKIVIEKAWWVSFFVLFCSQLIDIQYYDGRISLIFWILLAGLRVIIVEKNREKEMMTKGDYIA